MQRATTHLHQHVRMLILRLTYHACVQGCDLSVVKYNGGLIRPSH